MTEWRDDQQWEMLQSDEWRDRFSESVRRAGMSWDEAAAALSEMPQEVQDNVMREARRPDGGEHWKWYRDGFGYARAVEPFIAESMGWERIVVPGRIVE